jgi:hypothetical protein
MGSQLDLDQGGTIRQLQNVYMGPSIGWVPAAFAALLNVITAGPISILTGNSLILVSFNGAVVLNLPKAKGNAAGAGAVPGTFIQTPVTIVDAGGFASGTNTITINAAVGEAIDGLSTIQIVSPFGAYVLTPNITSGGWTLTQS